MKAYVEAYGCTLNVGESREVRSFLERGGWDLVDKPSDADLAVLVTCVVIGKTERKMLKRIRELRTVPRLIITGCMATACREKARNVASSAEFVPPGDISSLASVLGAHIEQNRSAESTAYPFTIVPIATGCVGKCAYCITQIARGSLRSRKPAKIVEAVREAVVSGPREIQLTAQDTAAYGSDIGSDLPQLVREVCAIPRDFRVRIGMMNPRSVLPLLSPLMSMYLEPKVFKFLHLPVQSGSDAVLARMGRGYSVHDFERIIRRLRDHVPRMTLSTDLIVGYPGETDADHRSNLELVSRAEPDIVNVTKFSERPGTRAAGELPRIAGWKAKERSRELTRLRFSIALKKNKLWVGQRVRALSTEPGKPGTTIFRTEEYRQVVVPRELNLGRWAIVLVTGATTTYLKGVMEGPG